MRTGLLFCVVLVAGMSAPVSQATAPRSVYVNCWHTGGAPTHSTFYTARAQPRSCVIWGMPTDLANLYTLRHLRWVDWGTVATTFTGQVRNTHPGMGGPLWSTVSGRLSGIHRGCEGISFYSRMTFPGSDIAPVRLSSACRPAA